MSPRLSTVFAAFALPALGTLVGAPAGQAGVYVTGSVSSQTTNLGFQTAASQYGSASVDIDLGHYVRLGYTYGVEYQSTQAFKDPSSTGIVDDTYCTKSCDQTYNNTRTIENSIGLTLVLYEGQIFMPFLIGGVIHKVLTVQSRDYDSNHQLVDSTSTQPTPLEPYGGGGMGIRLNKDFMLKFSYQVSPGVIKVPGEDAHATWDKRTTIGLTYQFL